MLQERANEDCANEDCANEVAPSNTCCLQMEFLAWAFVGASLPQFPYSLLFLLSPLLGLRVYSPKDQEICATIQKRLRNFTHWIDASRGYGYSVSLCPFYLAHTTVKPDGIQLFILTTKAVYASLSELHYTMHTTSLSLPSNMKLYERTGTFGNCWFRKRSLTCKFEPRQSQEDILESISTWFLVHKNCTAFISGPPGAGKTMLGLLLAHQLQGSYCNSLKPWQPGDSLSELYTESEPTEHCPLIISFDEIDSVISNVHTKKIPQHVNSPTAIADKHGWNKFFDDLGRGMYPNCIVLLTSNANKESIDALDASYLREGRVNLHFVM